MCASCCLAGPEEDSGDSGTGEEAATTQACIWSTTCITPPEVKIQWIWRNGDWICQMTWRMDRSIGVQGETCSSQGSSVIRTQPNICPSLSYLMNFQVWLKRICASPPTSPPHLRMYFWGVPTSPALTYSHPDISSPYGCVKFFPLFLYLYTKNTKLK